MRLILSFLLTIIVSSIIAQHPNLVPHSFQITNETEVKIQYDPHNVNSDARSSMEIHPELAARFQFILDSCYNETGAVGVSASVNIPDGIWNGVQGEASIERAVEKTDIFGVGSVTKTITSAAIFKLQEADLLSLDDAIVDWIPNIGDYTFIDPSAKIYQLLQHTSGIFDYTSHPSFADSIYGGDFTRVWTPTEILEKFLDAPVFITGQSWAYSNTNYLLLGLIIESAAGVPYHEYVRSAILEPIGLTDIRLFPYEQIASEHAHIYVDLMNDGSIDDIDAAGVDYESIFSSAWAAGAYTASAEDITTFAKLLYSGQILNQSSMDQLFGEYPLGGNAGYGMGVIIYSDAEGNPYLYGHNGAIFYSSNVFYFPAKDLAISLLANSNNVNANITINYLSDMIQACIDFVPSTTSKEKTITVEGIKIMPNPSSESINIRYNLLRNTELDIFVTDASGKRVSQIATGLHFAGANEIRWDAVEQLSNGIYFLEIVGEGVLETKVFVKE